MGKLVLLVTFFAAFQLAAYAQDPIVTIDGQNMVPLQTFTNQFGGTTSYDPTTNTYSVFLNGQYVYLEPYSTVAWIGDSQVNLAYPPVIVDNVMYVPLDFMCGAFGLNYSWEPGYQQVVIVFDGQRVFWGRDNTWSRRSHRWEHPDTYRVAPRFQGPPRLYFGRSRTSSTASRRTYAGRPQPSVTSTRSNQRIATTRPTSRTYASIPRQYTSPGGTQRYATRPNPQYRTTRTTSRTYASVPRQYSSPGGPQRSAPRNNGYAFGLRRPGGGNSNVRAQGNTSYHNQASSGQFHGGNTSRTRNSSNNRGANRHNA